MCHQVLSVHARGCGARQVLVDVQDRVATIRLNRPKQLNALNVRRPYPPTSYPHPWCHTLFTRASYWWVRGVSCACVVPVLFAAMCLAVHRWRWHASSRLRVKTCTSTALTSAPLSSREKVRCRSLCVRNTVAPRFTPANGDECLGWLAGARVRPSVLCWRRHEVSDGPPHRHTSAQQVQWPPLCCSPC